MTTIAYRDGVLAGDTLQTMGGTRVGYGVKIARAQDGSLVAGAGHSDYGATLRAWAAEGDGFPPLPPNDDSVGIQITPEGDVRILQHGGIAPTSAPFHALGSGMDIALGAMAAGASAAEAVEIAIGLDVGTGGTVETLVLAEIAQANGAQHATEWRAVRNEMAPDPLCGCACCDMLRRKHQR